MIDAPRLMLTADQPIAMRVGASLGETRLAGGTGGTLGALAGGEG